MKEFLDLKKQIELAKETIREEEREGKKSIYPSEIAETGKGIFKIQKEKQRLMEQLHAKLRQIDKGEEIFEEGRPVAKYNAKNKMFFVERPSKEFQVATFGDLITDASWGVDYNLDKSVPKNFQKRYALETTKQKIANLYDRQLILDKLAKKKKELEQTKKEVYLTIHQTTETEFGKSGLIFEKILKNLLFQLQYDLPNWDVKIEDINIVEDVEYHIDFIIVVKKHRRGAQIEEVSPEEIEKPLVLGVQFTLLPFELVPSERMSESRQRYLAKRYETKLLQLNQAKKHMEEMHLDDLILVSMPTDEKEIKSKYQTWKKLGKPIGGPERLYDTFTKITILKALLQKMGIDDILENQEERLKEYYNSKLASVEQ